jgi:hypothetical protein
MFLQAYEPGERRTAHRALLVRPCRRGDERRSPSEVEVVLSYDETLVLSHLMSRWETDGTESRLPLDDQAEQRVWWDLNAGLEPLIDEAFSDNYLEAVELAWTRLRDPVDERPFEMIISHVSTIEGRGILATGTYVGELPRAGDQLALTEHGRTIDTLTCQGAEGHDARGFGVLLGIENRDRVAEGQVLSVAPERHLGARRSGRHRARGTWLVTKQPPNGTGDLVELAPGAGR